MKLQFRGTPNASAPPALGPKREPWGPATVGTGVRVHQQDRVQRAGWGGRRAVKRGRGSPPDAPPLTQAAQPQAVQRGELKQALYGASVEPLAPVQVAEWAEKRVCGQFLCLEANFPRSLDSEGGAGSARRGEEPQARARRSWHEA